MVESRAVPVTRVVKEAGIISRFEHGQPPTHAPCNGHPPRHVPTGVDISCGDMREREILFTSFLRACLCWTRVRRGFKISLFLSLPVRWHVMMRDLSCPSNSCRSDTERPGQEGVIVTPRFLRLGRPASQVIACFHLPPCRLYILKNSSLGCLGVSSD